MQFQEITLLDYEKPLAERKASRRYVGPYRWTPAQPGGSRGFYQDRIHLAMDRHGSAYNLRLELANNYLRGSRLAMTDGYYIDAEGIETIEPIIVLLPHGRGYLPGWTMGAGMCGAFELEVYDTPEDAARAAHHLAERDAEEMAAADEVETERESWMQ